MVEREPPHRYAFRQAPEKFCGDGLIGLCHAVFAALLFVQSLRFSAGNGSFDSNTLRTTLDKLGLKTRLTDMTSAAKLLSMTFDEQLSFPVEDTLLKLKLSVRPVKTGDELPAIGSYSSTLLMEIIYR